MKSPKKRVKVTFVPFSLFHFSKSLNQNEVDGGPTTHKIHPLSLPRFDQELRFCHTLTTYLESQNPMTKPKPNPRETRELENEVLRDENFNFYGFLVIE